MSNTLKTQTLILAPYLAAALLIHYFVGGVLIGSSNSFLILVLTISLAIISTVSFFVTAEMKDKISYLSVVLGAGLLIGTCIPMLPHANASERVNHLLYTARFNMGEVTPAARKAKEIIDSRELFVQNREFIRDLGRGASAQPKDVLDFIEQANRLGVDTSFVSQNGIVRVSDKQRLYRETLAQARQGDEYAISLLENNPNHLARN